jgi:geranyl-CoA carboxylase beta subunit
MVRGPHPRLPCRAAAVEGATGEIATEEELGGAEMHTSISGLGDYLAEDDRDALRIARDIMANLEWDRPRAAEASFKPPRYDAEELLGIMPMDHKRPVRHASGHRALCRRFRFHRVRRELRSRPPCAATPASRGRRSGSSPTTARSMCPAPTRRRTFIQACCQSRTPILYMNNTTGYMVGKAVRGSRHDQARLQDDPGGDLGDRAADHDLLRRLVRRRQLRHVRARLPSALLLLLAQRQDRRDGRRAGRREPWRS